MTFPDEARSDLFRLWSAGSEGVESIGAFAHCYLAEKGFVLHARRFCRFILTDGGRELAAIVWATYAKRPKPVDSSISHPRPGQAEMYTGAKPVRCSVSGGRAYEMVPKGVESLFKYLWVHSQAGVAFKIDNSERLGVLYRSGLVEFTVQESMRIPIFTITRPGEEVARLMFLKSEDADDDEDYDYDDGDDDWKDGWYQPLLVTPTVWNESKQVFEKGRAYRVLKDGTRKYMKEQTTKVAVATGMLQTDEERRVLSLALTSLNSADSSASACRVLDVIDLIYGRVPQSAEIPVTIEECSQPEDDGPADNEAKAERPDERDYKKPISSWPV